MILTEVLSLALYTAVSSLSETMYDFEARISTHAVAVNEDWRVSICGMIGEANGRYSVRLNTDNTRRRCEIDLDDTLDGNCSTSVTFPTRTSDEDIVRGFSAQVFNRLRGYIAYGKVVRYQEGRTKERPIKTR